MMAMYDEFRKDLRDEFKDFPKKRTALWGRAIKELMEERKGKELESDVSWLAEKTGITDKHLFNIVAGRIQDPPSEKLIKIADAFQISFSELAERAVGEYPGTFYVATFGERGMIEYPQHGFSIQCFSPPGTGSRDFFLGVMTIEPYKEMTRWKFSDNSIVCLLVESGTLEINYGGKIKRIHTNQSAYFDASVPHRLRNIDSVDVRCFLVTRPPIH